MEPITKEELDKLYEDTFKMNNEHKENVMNAEQLTNRINDIDIERKNMDVETQDPALFNFVKEQGNNLNLNDLFEYIRYKNESKSLVKSDQIYTLETLPGYLNNFTSFVDDNEFMNSKFYSGVSEELEQNFTNEQFNFNQFNFNEFNEWKNNKKIDKKMTEVEMEAFLKLREQEEDLIFNDVTNNLTKKKQEIINFFDTPAISENIKKLTHSNDISSMDNVFVHMENVASSFANTTNDEKTTNTEFADLKYHREKPVINNIKKREFK
jgi:hypothetical protein